MVNPLPSAAFCVSNPFTSTIPRGREFVHPALGAPQLAISFLRLRAGELGMMDPTWRDFHLVRLLTNLCLAWTAAHMQEAIFGENGLAQKMKNQDWLRRVSPTHRGHLNFLGTFKFDIANYQEWLLSQPVRARSSR